MLIQSAESIQKSVESGLIKPTLQNLFSEPTKIDGDGDHGNINRRSISDGRTLVRDYALRVSSTTPRPC